MHRAMEMRVHKGSGIVTCRQMLTMKNIENILMMSRTANHLLPLSLRVSTTYTVIQGVPSLVESGNDQFLEGGKRKTSIFEVEIGIQCRSGRVTNVRGKRRLPIPPGLLGIC